MYSSGVLIAAIAAMWLATFPPRFLPLAIFSRIRLPARVKAFLEDVPTAVFAAILAQSLWTEATAPTPTLALQPLLGGVSVALLVARWRRSLLLGTIAGATMFVSLDWFR